MRKKYFESLAQTIQAGLSGLEDDEKKIDTTTQDEESKKAMVKNIETKRNSLYMLQRLLS